MTIGIYEFAFRQAQSQGIWEPNVTPKAEPYRESWETLSRPNKDNESQIEWETVPEDEYQNQHPSIIIWEVLSPDDITENPPSGKKSNSSIIPPKNLEEAEALLDIIPLQSSDFKPLLKLSHTVPTASVLSQEEWRLISSTISPFKYAGGTGNRNNAIQLSYGLSNSFQISGFYSKADAPLNTKIKGLNIRPSNFWEVFGAEGRWIFLPIKFFAGIK